MDPQHTIAIDACHLILYFMDITGCSNLRYSKNISFNETNKGSSMTAPIDFLIHYPMESQEN